MSEALRRRGEADGAAGVGTLVTQAPAQPSAARSGRGVGGQGKQSEAI